MRNVALVPGKAALLLTLAIALAYSCVAPEPGEQGTCPCLDQPGYVCCATTGKCLLAGTPCAPVPGPDADGTRNDSGNTSDGSAGAAGRDGSGGAGGGGGTDARPSRDSGTANELTVDRWRPISVTDAPSVRVGSTAVWTGKVMIVWGGEQRGAPLSTGARYDPAMDSWTVMSTLRAPLARHGHTAVWSGGAMIVWGGVDSNNVVLDSGGRYDPESDSWSPMSRTGAASPRTGHIAEWSGAQMLIWGGGTSDNIFLAAGGRYDPGTDSWSPMSDQGAPGPVQGTRAIWTGNELLLYGGYDLVGHARGAVGLYHPASDRWQPFPIRNAPRDRIGHVVVWSGREAIIWGGSERVDSPARDGGISTTFDAGTITTENARGGAFDVAAGTWRLISPSDQPKVGSQFAQAVFAPGAGTRATGLMLVAVSGGYQGGAYDPVSDQWFALSMQGAPIFNDAFAFWTGREMLIWGTTSAEDGRIIPGGALYQP
jgi:hypothetical protein